MTSVQLGPSSHSGLTPHGRGWMVASGVLAVVGVVLVALTYVLRNVNEDLAGWSYTIGFLAVYGAIVAYLVGRILDRGDRPTLLPVTVLGWVVLAAVAVTVVFFFTDLVILGFWAFGAAAVAAVALVLIGHERSVPVFALPLLGALFAAAFVFGEVTIGHA